MAQWKAMNRSARNRSYAFLEPCVIKELNHLSNQYALQLDGFLLSGGGYKPNDVDYFGHLVGSGSPVAVDRQNWVHDALEKRSGKWGIRIDRDNQECEESQWFHWYTFAGAQTLD